MNVQDHRPHRVHAQHRIPDHLPHHIPHQLPHHLHKQQERMPDHMTCHMPHHIHEKQEHMPDACAHMRGNAGDGQWQPKPYTLNASDG